jgi:hypothetical protein
MKQVTPHFLTGPGAARALLAAALMAASFSATIITPSGPAEPLVSAPPSPLAAATETPRLVQRILSDEFEAQPAESDEKGELPSYAAEYAAFRRLQLVNDKGEIPIEAPGNAHKAFEQSRLRTLRTPSLQVGGISGNWLFEGPTNIGGRIRAIVLPGLGASPPVLGSAGGGIWRHDGSKWVLADGMSNMAVNAMVVNPANPSQLIAGTGEGFFNGDALRGDGLFQSADSGQTWTQLPSTGILVSQDFAFVNRLAMPADGSAILAATRTGLWRSINGGTSWSNRIPGAAILDVQTHPTVITRAVASGYGVAYYSFEAGSTWLQSTFAPTLTVPPAVPPVINRVEVAFSPSNPMIVYASVHNNQGRLYKSTDAGASFNLINDGEEYLGEQGWYGNSIWVNPTNPNDIIVGGVDLYRSTNGGVSLSKITNWSNYQLYGTTAHADHHVIVSPRDYDGVITKTIWFGNDGGLFRVDDINSINLGITHLTDAGFTHVEGLGITQFFGVAASFGGGVLRVVGGAQDNGTPLQGAASNWKDIYGGDGGFVAIDPADSKIMYGEYVNLKIFRSKDGGASTSTIDKSTGVPGIGQITDSREDSTALFIAPFILDPGNSNTMLAGGASLWRSTDVRTAYVWPSWSAIKAPVVLTGSIERISAIAVAPNGPDVIWVGHERGGLFMTTNGSAAVPAWTAITSTSLPAGRYVTRITFDPGGSQVVYVSYGGYNPDNVWKTTDGGANWAPLFGTGGNILPPAPVRTGPLKILFIGNRYTEGNDLPELVASLARAGGERPLEIGRQIHGGYTLEQHYATGAPATIRSRDWEVVVLQEQSMRPIIDRRAFLAYGRLLGDEVHAVDGKVLLFMTWARKHLPETQARLTDAYNALAAETDGEVAPVGVAWQLSYAAMPGLNLHTDDDSHPNPAGSYLAACTFYAALFGRTPVGLPGRLTDAGGGVLVEVPPATANHLQRMAWDAVQRNGR